MRALSFETYLKDVFKGQEDPSTGAQRLVLHPTLVYSPGTPLLFFGVVSIPAWQSYNSPENRERFRVGGGILYGF